MQPYPEQDTERLDRITQDVADMLHSKFDEETQRKIQRFITLTVEYIAKRKPAAGWWFLENVAQASLAEGNDIVDMVGHINRVKTVWLPLQLNKRPLGWVIDQRQQAADDSSSNAGRPTSYAIEAGKRLHLWPAPDGDYTIKVLYSRQAKIELFPDNWDEVILNGVLARYAKHFDRDGLVGDVNEFDGRFREGLRLEQSGDNGLTVTHPWVGDKRHPSSLLASPDSDSDTATSVVVPASTTGLGYVTIETGVYPLQVP